MRPDRSPAVLGGARPARHVASRPPRPARSSVRVRAAALPELDERALGKAAVCLIGIVGAAMFGVAVVVAYRDSAASDESSDLLVRL